MTFVWIYLNYKSAMRWLQQSTQGTSTKSCWSPLWPHSSWALVCCSYYSGLASMCKGTFEMFKFNVGFWNHFNRCVVFDHSPCCFPPVLADWLAIMTHSSGAKDITHNTNWILDLIGLHWHYGIIWTLDLFSQVKGISTTFAVFLSLSWLLL